MWRGRREYSPDCWHFSTSSDGVKFNNAVSLAACANLGSLDEQSSAYLLTSIRQAKTGRPVSLEVLTLRDYLARVGISATLDGVFHPLWSTSRHGFGEVRTASVWVGDKSQPLAKEHVDLPSLKEVTDKITVLYGSQQHIDRETNSVMVDISFRNNSLASITDTLYLKLENASSDFGNLELVNPSPETSPGPGYLNLSSALHRGSLGKDETSSPYRLTFHFTRETLRMPNRFSILKIKLRFFCRQQT